VPSIWSRARTPDGRLQIGATRQACGHRPRMPKPYREQPWHTRRRSPPLSIRYTGNRQSGVLPGGGNVAGWLCDGGAPWIPIPAVTSQDTAPNTTTKPASESKNFDRAGCSVCLARVCIVAGGVAALALSQPLTVRLGRLPAGRTQRSSEALVVSTPPQFSSKDQHPGEGRSTIEGVWFP
jgi:hypothetical protein